MVRTALNTEFSNLSATAAVVVTVVVDADAAVAAPAAAVADAAALAAAVPAVDVGVDVAAAAAAALAGLALSVLVTTLRTTPQERVSFHHKDELQDLSRGVVGVVVAAVVVDVVKGLLPVQKHLVVQDAESLPLVAIVDVVGVDVVAAAAVENSG